jgi:putative ABC transport system permease protein
MNSLFANLRAFWRGARRPAHLDTDMDDEMRFHVEMETQRLQQRGLDAAEARRQAAIAFGGVEKYRGAGRDALGLTWLRGFSTDLKLGTRMLRKYPGLTVVGILALSLAIGAGAAYLEFVNDLYRPTLPFADGARLVGIQNRDLQTGSIEDRVAWDFVGWRGTLRSIGAIGAYAPLDRNLITGDGRSEVVKGVTISASVFQMLRVPPALGRPLVDSDERDGAAPVAVIGHELWQSRFAGDGGVVGQTIKLGTVTHTIVGVMPPGFGFPISHDLWAPLPLNRADYRRREGPAIKVFGLLAPGVRLSEAQAELAALGMRAATDSPATHQHLRPQVKAYVASLWAAQSDGEAAAYVLYAGNLFFIGLLGLCGANMATLVFARTATRATEINVRTALGASRARIAGQLFAEALVLCSFAAGVGLLTAYYGSIWVKRAVFLAQGLRPMFWWNDRLSIETLLYAGVLAVIGAVIVGVIPAWKATGAQVQDGLKQAHTVQSGLKFGGMWTGVIVSQVALTVIFLCIVGALGYGVWFGRGGITPLAFRGEEFIAVRLGMDGDASADAALRNRFRSSYEELERRVLAEKGVASVTYATRLPGTGGPAWEIEVAGGKHKGPDGVLRVQTADVSINLFQAFGAPIVAGRGFVLADTSENSNAAIVDEAFVRHVLPDVEPIGAQVRRVAQDNLPAGPWLEVVGVVRDLTNEYPKSDENTVLYRPLVAGAAFPFQMGVRASGDPKAVMAQLRPIAAAVDPTLRLDTIRTIEQLAGETRVGLDFFTRVGVGIAMVALLLSISGVYALMSFTVARRTPEIAIRLALGANANRVVLATFSRALLQVSLGVLVGCIPGGAIVSVLEPEVMSGSQLWMTMGTCAAVVAFMAVTTIAACYGPARRALRIQPTDALKAM